MDVLNAIETNFDLVVFWGLVLLRAWAIVDCAIRKAAAFPAVDKLTKPAWLGILVVSELLGMLLPGILFWMLSIIAALVYLVDVRPAVREVTRGNN
jgi:hypothetical protein